MTVHIVNLLFLRLQMFLHIQTVLLGCPLVLNAVVCGSSFTGIESWLSEYNCKITRKCYKGGSLSLELSDLQAELE